MALTSEQIHEALGTVQDPDLGKDLVTLRMVKGVRIDGDDVHIQIELTTPACPLKDKIRDDIEQAVTARAAETDAALGAVEVEFSASVRGAGKPSADNPLPDVKHVIAVGAG